MRAFLIAAAALLASSSAAQAAPASVTVRLSPELHAKAQATLGVREVGDIADLLRKDVQRAAARAPATDNARIELVLTDLEPNRPTFKQLGDHPGLSMHSRSVGGMAVTGQVVRADGSVTPIDYRYYQLGLEWARTEWTWGDASAGFEQLAAAIAHGESLVRH